MTTENKSVQNENDLQKALEKFVVDNPDLERLEGLLEQFNIFEALGAVRQELRHSDFLAFLLNPQENHSLDDVFLKRILQRAIFQGDTNTLSVSPIDMDVWDMNGSIVLREWENIDILIEDKSNNFVVVIENKIGSGEHSKQLERYRKTVESHYTGWKILYLYLTPEGTTPSDEAYLPIDYGVICSMLEDLIESRASTLGPDVRTLMMHYAEMLRRHIVSESEIQELCERLYHKHRRALDILFENRPDLQGSVREYLELLIQDTEGMVLDHCSKTYIRFIPGSWDVPALQTGKGWTRSGRLLLFEFVNSEDRVSLKLTIGPGPQKYREALYEIASVGKTILKPSFKKIGANWSTIYTRKYVSKKEYEGSSQEELEEKIQEGWGRFLANDLPKIEDAINLDRFINL